MPSLDFTTWTPRAHALLRIVTGYTFLLFGTAKILHVPHIEQLDGLPLVSLVGLAGLIELVAGLLVLLGLFTRPAAFIASGEMAVAYFKGHATLTTVHLPVVNNGTDAVLYCFVFLYFAAAGSGIWSLDALRGGPGRVAGV